MHGHQSIRFIGGPLNGTHRIVAPSTNEIGASNVYDFWGRALLGPSDTTYKRRKLVLRGDLNRYEEECFVDTRLTEQQALVELAKQMKAAPKIPEFVETRPLKVNLDSSLIHSLAYDDRTGTLDVTLKCRGKNEPAGTYRYRNVGLGTLGALLSAPSIGAAYVKHIRNQFPCEQL